MLKPNDVRLRREGVGRDEVTQPDPGRLHRLASGQQCHPEGDASLGRPCGRVAREQCRPEQHGGHGRDEANDLADDGPNELARVQRRIRKEEAVDRKHDPVGDRQGDERPRSTGKLPGEAGQAVRQVRAAGFLPRRAVDPSADRLVHRPHPVPRSACRQCCPRPRGARSPRAHFIAHVLPEGSGRPQGRDASWSREGLRRRVHRD